jgi:uncharacterized repeat protein (TIGR02543 family)
MGDQSIANSATSVMLYPSNYSREGYGFAGWNTEADGSGEMYDIDGSFYPIEASGKSEVTLYATWEKITATE